MPLSAETIISARDRGNCDVCGRYLGDATQFFTGAILKCKHCGAERCQKCRKFSPQNARFCQNCSSENDLERRERKMAPSGSSNEREVYRTRVEKVLGFSDGRQGECIVSTDRIIVRWSDGEITQIPIITIQSVKFVRDLNYSRWKNDRPGVIITTISDNVGLWLATPSGQELASRIQSAIMPF